MKSHQILDCLVVQEVHTFLKFYFLKLLAKFLIPSAEPLLGLSADIKLFLKLFNDRFEPLKKTNKTLLYLNYSSYLFCKATIFAWVITGSRLGFDGTFFIDLSCEGIAEGG